MSAIQLLERIGASATAPKHDKKAIKNELDGLLDICPEIISFLVPAEDDEEDNKKDEEGEKKAIGF